MCRLQSFREGVCVNSSNISERQLRFQRKNTCNNNIYYYYLLIYRCCHIPRKGEQGEIICKIVTIRIFNL